MKAPTLTGLVADRVDPGTEVFTDEARGYLPLSRMGYQHSSLAHSVGQYVDGMAHTNGMESFWAMLLRGYHGTYYRMSEEHMRPNVSEFSRSQNVCPEVAADQLARMVVRKDRKHLPYKELIADGARARGLAS